MGPADIIALCLLAGLVVIAVVVWRRKRRSGGCGSGSCSSCEGCPHHRSDHPDLPQ